MGLSPSEEALKRFSRSALLERGGTPPIHKGQTAVSPGRKYGTHRPDYLRLRRCRPPLTLLGRRLALQAHGPTPGLRDVGGGCRGGGGPARGEATRILDPHFRA